MRRKSRSLPEKAVTRRYFGVYGLLQLPDLLLLRPRWQPGLEAGGALCTYSALLSGRPEPWAATEDPTGAPALGPRNR